jgi:hypothetical protein
MLSSAGAAPPGHGGLVQNQGPKFDLACALSDRSRGPAANQWNDDNADDELRGYNYQPLDDHTGQHCMRLQGDTACFCPPTYGHGAFYRS